MLMTKIHRHPGEAGGGKAITISGRGEKNMEKIRLFLEKLPITPKINRERRGECVHVLPKVGAIIKEISSALSFLTEFPLEKRAAVKLLEEVKQLVKNLADEISKEERQLTIQLGALLTKPEEEPQFNFLNLQRQLRKTSFDVLSPTRPSAAESKESLQRQQEIIQKEMEILKDLQTALAKDGWVLAAINEIEQEVSTGGHSPLA